MELPVSKYAILFERKNELYFATIPDVPGVGVVGRTLEEAQSLIREALMNQAITLRDVDGEEIPPASSFTQYLLIPTSDKGWIDRPTTWKFVNVLSSNNNA